VVGRSHQGFDRVSHVQATCGAMADVKDEIPVAVPAVANECAAGRAVGVNENAGDVDAITTQPIQIQASEIVITNSRYQGDRLPYPGNLIGEDGRGPGWKGSGKRLRLAESVTDRVGHDLDQDFPDNHNLFPWHNTIPITPVTSAGRMSML